MTDTTATTTAADTSIHRVGAADVAAASRTLAAAFHDDPVFTWCVPDGARRPVVLPAFFELCTTTLLAHDEVLRTADHAAVALWVPPGRAPVADDQAPAFEARAVEVVGPDAERMFAISAMLDEHHPVADHRFLWFLGVVPHRQGLGLGSTLLASMLDRCDREGAAAYLDATSEHNRRLYERHGFVVTAERSVDGSPPLWAMWREPR